MSLLPLSRSPQLSLDGLELVLRDNRPLRLAGAKGYHLRCTGGCAWVTVPGDPRDIYLFAGDDWQVPGDGQVLIESVGGAVVALGR